MVALRATAALDDLNGVSSLNGPMSLEAFVFYKLEKKPLILCHFSTFRLFAHIWKHSVV